MATGTVTYGASPMGGSGYNTSDGNSYSSASAAQAHQNTINAASSAPTASTTTTAKATTPATTTAPAPASSSTPSLTPVVATIGGVHYIFNSQQELETAQNNYNQYGNISGSQTAPASSSSTATPVTTGNTSVDTYVGNTTAASTTPSTTTPSTTTGALSDTSLSGLASSLLSEIQNLMGNIQTTTPSASQIQTLGNQYAQSQVDPQLTQLASELATAQTQEQSNISQTQAADSQLPQEANTMLTNVRQQAMNDAIARGAGTSGVYDYDYEKLAEPVTESIDTSESQEAASIQDYINQLGTTTSNIANQQQTDVAQEGNLSANYQQQLQEYYNAAQSGDLSSLLSAATNLASLGEQTSASNANTALNTLVAIMTATGKVPTGTTLTDILNGTYTNTASAPAAGSPTTTPVAPAAPAAGAGAVAAGTSYTAYDPTTGSVIPIQEDLSGHTTTQLPIGAIITIAGNYYKITGGSPGAYTSVQVSTAKG